LTVIQPGSRGAPAGARERISPEHDHLGIYSWPVPLDPGDTLTTENGQRFRVVAVVDLGMDAVVDRLVEVEPVGSFAL
jgi:hypothetical protein